MAKKKKGKASHIKTYVIGVIASVGVSLLFSLIGAFKIKTSGAVNSGVSAMELFGIIFPLFIIVLTVITIGVIALYYAFTDNKKGK